MSDLTRDSQDEGASLPEAPPDPLGEAIARAWSFFGPGDYDGALAAWREVAREFPWHFSGHIGVVSTQIRRGELDAAADILPLLLLLSPDHPDILALRPELVAAQGNLPAAFQDWRELRERFPDHGTIRDAYMTAQWKLQLQHLSSSKSHPPIEVAKVSDPATRKLFLRFEGLGDNCEFGLVQRRFDAEPLGLLRWSNGTYEKVTSLLENRLFGFGELEHTKVGLFENGEYWVRDLLYGLGPFHTFISGQLVDETKFHFEHSRRFRRLCERFREDLSDGEKIFLFKSSVPMSDAAAVQMHDAMKKLGDNRLLVVRAADDDNPPGSVRRATDTLLFGYLRSTAPQIIEGQGGVWDIAYDDWVAICLEAVRQTESLYPSR